MGSPPILAYSAAPISTMAPVGAGTPPAGSTDTASPCVARTLVGISNTAETPPDGSAWNVPTLIGAPVVSIHNWYVRPAGSCGELERKVGSTTKRVLEAHDRDQLRFDKVESKNFDNRMMRLLKYRMHQNDG